MIRGAIFDIDGTLLDSMPIWADAGARYLRSIGVEPARGLGDVLFPMTLEQGAEYLKKEYGLAQSTEDIRAGVLQVVANFYREEAQLKPGVADFLQRLWARGIPMALATTGDESLAQAALERLDVWQYFSAIFTATGLNTSKHEPLIYQKATKALGTTPAETAVFEDVLHAVQTAKDAGFFTVAVEDAASEAQSADMKAIADRYIQDFSQLEL